MQMQRRGLFITSAELPWRYMLSSMVVARTFGGVVADSNRLCEHGIQRLPLSVGKPSLEPHFRGSMVPVATGLYFSRPARRWQGKGEENILAAD